MTDTNTEYFGDEPYDPRDLDKLEQLIEVDSDWLNTDDDADILSLYEQRKQELDRSSFVTWALAFDLCPNHTCDLDTCADEVASDTRDCPYVDPHFYAEHMTDYVPLTCDRELTLGTVDPYSTSCDLPDGHTGPHEGTHPVDPDAKIRWTGGGTCAGDPLPARIL